MESTRTSWRVTFDPFNRVMHLLKMNQWYISKETETFLARFWHRNNQERPFVQLPLYRELEPCKSVELIADQELEEKTQRFYFNKTPGNTSPLL